MLLFRLADEGDLDSISRIESVSFPAGDRDRKSARGSQLEDGIESGQVIVAASKSLQDKPIAYIQFHRVSNSSEIYVEGVAVDPLERGSGVAVQLLDALIFRLEKDETRSLTYSMTVSPNNAGVR